MRRRFNTYRSASAASAAGAATASTATTARSSSTSTLSTSLALGSSLSLLTRGSGSAGKLNRDLALQDLLAGELANGTLSLARG